MTEVLEITGMISSFLVGASAIITIVWRLLSSYNNYDLNEPFIRIYYPIRAKVIINHTFMLILLTIVAALTIINEFVQLDMITNEEINIQNI